MKIPDSLSEKQPMDVETAGRNPAETKDILEPLQLLLAARRGLRADPTFTTTNVPDDRLLLYAGESGVDSLAKGRVWNRAICTIGYMRRPWILPFWAFYTGFLFSSLGRDADGDDEGQENNVFFHQLRVGGYAAAAMIILLAVARICARKRMAAATPPPVNPNSYQYRLVQALKQRDIEFREVVATPFEEMEKVWKEDSNLQEKFRIEGLVDSDGSSVYDIVVRFWINGNVNMQFASTAPEGTSQSKSGVLLRPREEKS